MPTPSSSPRGEKAGRPGTAWSTTVRWSGEEVVIDDGPWGGPATIRPWTPDGTATAPPKPNRATRRALARHNRRKNSR